MDSGSAIPSTSREEVYDLDISLPPLHEQKAIASVLSSLDDKIDLLHRQNNTLEAMAEALFRQWFVEEAEEDWEEYAVSDIADNYKLNIKPEQNATTFFYHYSIPAFDSGKTPILEAGSSILSNKYKVLSNSILVSKLNPRFPRVWAVLGSVPENSICSTELQVFTPKEENMYAFLYFLFSSEEVAGKLEAAASGTSGSHQRVTSKDMLNIKFLLPNIESAITFSKVAIHFLEKIQKNRNTVRTLEQLRDTLLPKLMSGEVRVAC